jgi:hypothetical protein
MHFYSSGSSFAASWRIAPDPLQRQSRTVISGWFARRRKQAATGRWRNGQATSVVGVFAGGLLFCTAFYLFLY